MISLEMEVEVKKSIFIVRLRCVGIVMSMVTLTQVMI